MKKILILFCLLFFYSSWAWAGPFLVCDPYQGSIIPTYYKVTGATGFPATIPPDSTGTYGFKYDLSAFPAGSYTLTAVACIVDPNFGEQCSGPSNPLALTRSGIPSMPTSLKLVVQ